MNLYRHADYAREQVFDADVVVVGTGAGGAAAGAELAEAGLDVIFVEEGGYHPTGSFNPYMTESVPRLYRDAGTTAILGRPAIPYMEGRCVGGTTVINGGMAYRAPDEVLAGWERLTGDKAYGPEGMAPIFAEVEETISARKQRPESIGDDNRIMHLGAEKLGWKSELNPRAQDRCVGTNNCILGCPTGGKQSALVSTMPRAMRAGARCLTEVRVERLIVEGGRCVGVVGRSPDPRTRREFREVTVRARAVVVAAGAIHTPYLLLGQKVGRPSRQLGRNFLCHPNAKVMAYYPFDVKAWQGVSQWSQVREFRNEGILFAENMIPPWPVGAALPWHGDKSMELLERYNQMLVTGVLVEDSTTGRVTRGPLGMPITRYDITDWDFHRFVDGVKRLSELHFAMGADLLVLPFRGAHVARSMDDVRKVTVDTVKKHHIELFTVHLMGTARLGARPEDSVVDPNGQLWDLPGCYVSDASLFPTAVGVNPQVTIMALAVQVGRRLAERLLRQRARAAA